jgi:predicted DNA-binding transcriptional regulator YafY
VLFNPRRKQFFFFDCVVPNGALAHILEAVEAALSTFTKVLFEDRSFRAAPFILAVAVLSSALQTGRCVQLHYRSASSEVTERGFDPYGVISQEGIWYTIGYCDLRQEQRLFRLDRIVQIEITAETFFVMGCSLHRPTLACVVFHW